MWARSQLRSLEPFLAVLLAGQAAASVQAQTPGCGITAVLDRTPPAFVYDPFDALPPVERTELSLTAADPAEALVTFETEAGIPLPVELGTTGVTLSINAEQVGRWSATNPGSVAVDLTAEQPRTIGVDFLLDNVAVALPGSYRQRVFVRVQNRTTGVICADRPAFDVVMDVPPRAQMNIAGANGDFNRSLRVAAVDFGSLAEGVTRQVFLQIRTNSPVRLAINSQNNGALVLRLNGSIEGRVPYDTTLAGAPVNLSGGWATSLPAALTFAGRSLPLVFRIGPVPPVPSGAYSDLLTITVTAF